MKTLNTVLLAVAMLIILACTSCHKASTVTPVTTGALGSNYPTVLNTIVTPAQIDTLKKHGLVINDGTTPPVVNGIYYLSPDSCIYDNSSANAGKIFSGYQYQFLNQDNTKYTLTVNYSNAIVGGDDSGTDGAATYISGNGQYFTVFAQVTGELSGVTYKELQVLSGQLITGGVKKFQWSFLMVSKTSDPGNAAVVPVGTIRIFEDGDGTSELQTTLNAINPKLIQSVKLPEFNSRIAAQAKQ